MSREQKKQHKLSDNHWRMEHFSERMTTQEWKEHLLREDDKIIFEGRCRTLVAKKIGCGVVEVSKEELSQ